MKYGLNKGLTFLFKFCFYCIWIGFAGFLIYGLIELDFSAVIFLGLFNLLILIYYFKKIRKFKVIEFDDKAIYYDEKVISMNEIKKVNFGKIIYNDGLDEEYILFYCLPLSDSTFDLFKEFYGNFKRSRL
jgi:hypothetical protein